MNGYIIRTAYGNQYRTDKYGYVLEYSNGLKKDRNSESRKTWQIIGAWKNTGFGYIKRISLFALLRGDETLLLTNGKPRFGLIDVNHGTHRLVGNKSAHGVVGISTY